MRPWLLAVAMLFQVLSGALTVVGASENAPATDSTVLVFREAGFPVADTGGALPETTYASIAGTRFATFDQLGPLLTAPATHLLVLPYGSAFPEQAWGDIYQYLQRGGNLLVLGGRPFTRAAFRDSSGWHLRDYSVRFIRQLMIDQYEITPGSEGLEFSANPNLPIKIPPFGWAHGFSPVIRLSAVDLYHRGGAAGSIDARIEALAWGVKDGRRLAAPGVVIDHLQNGFDGGRWIFLNSDLSPAFYQNSAYPDFIAELSQLAVRGSQEFTVRPTLPLYLSGESIPLDVAWHSAASAAPLTLKVRSYPEANPTQATETSQTFPLSQPLILPAPSGNGLFFIEAELLEGKKRRAIYHAGFWIRDEAFLHSGGKLTTNRDYLEVDGKPLAVVGTTYMSSEVQRLYFEHPNVYIWDKDLAQIQSSGLNMIRSGWWTGWDKFCDENGHPYDRTLRTIEAYLMTARKHGLPVQFNFFAFLPEILGGINPYLDPQAVRKQQTLVAAVSARFHDVPYLAWDLINEPSFSQHLWTMRPNGDPIELASWNRWLAARYPDRASLAAAWNLPVSEAKGNIPLPDELEFAQRGMYVGHNSLKVYDYNLFAQEGFAEWVKGMRGAIRGTGASQPITVGQDEGGYQDRLTPAFFGPYVDFTTTHSWWLNDSLLWDSLVAKQPGIAMLVQETGLQRELNQDETARRTPENEAVLLERKVALSFVQGSGAIEWLWNTNSYMTESNETPIGAVRPDGTEKPEATLLRNFAGFAKSLGAHLQNPRRPPVAIITSQAAQFSTISALQLEAQQKSVRALAYYDHVTPFVLTENQIDKMGAPKLAILPSPQSLTDAAWRSLLQYVNDGGALLITGPIGRDEHWQNKLRAADLHVEGHSEALVVHNATVRVKDRVLPLSFDQQKQTWLEMMQFTDGSKLKELNVGKGSIFWCAYPIELSDGVQASADLYSYVLRRAGVEAVFQSQVTLPPGVLVSATQLEDSILYVFASEDADTTIDVRDKLTGARIAFNLPSQRAAIALVGIKEKAVIAKYNF
jgi:hypothetical protein